MNRITNLLLPTCLLGIAICASSPEKPSWSKQILTKDFVTEGVAVADIDGDGVSDLVAGHLWFKGPDFLQAVAYRKGKAHDISGYVEDSFLCWAEDVTGDAKNDILAVGWPGREITLYQNPGKADGEWTASKIAAEAATESPIWIDISGDGKKEIVCMKQGCFGYYSADWTDVTKPWVFTAISEKRTNTPYMHGLGAGDLSGDGKADIIEKDGWFEQPAALPGTWVWHKLPQTCPGGSQMLVADLDKDGDNDVVTSLNGHGYGLGWYENQNKEMIYHEILPADPAKTGADGLQFSQLHALALGDFDSDGRMDFVTGKRYWAHGKNDPGSLDPALTVVYFNRQNDKSIRWESKVVESDGGVGCDVTAVDLNKDGKLDIAVGSKKGVFVIRQ